MSVRGRSTLAKCVPASQGSQPRPLSHVGGVRGFLQKLFSFQTESRGVTSPWTSLVPVTSAQYPLREKGGTQGGRPCAHQGPPETQNQQDAHETPLHSERERARARNDARMRSRGIYSKNSGGYKSKFVGRRWLGLRSQLKPQASG